MMKKDKSFFHTRY